MRGEDPADLVAVLGSASHGSAGTAASNATSAARATAPFADNEAVCACCLTGRTSRQRCLGRPHLCAELVLSG